MRDLNHIGLKAAIATADGPDPGVMGPVGTQDTSVTGYTGATPTGDQCYGCDRVHSRAGRVMEETAPLGGCGVRVDTHDEGPCGAKVASMPACEYRTFVFFVEHGVDALIHARG